MPSNWYRAATGALSYSATTARPMTQGVVTKYARDQYGEESVSVYNRSGRRIVGRAYLVGWGRRGGVVGISSLHTGSGRVDLQNNTQSRYRVGAMYQLEGDKGVSLVTSRASVTAP